MKRTFSFKLLISIIFSLLISSASFAQSETKFISLAPSITEIIYYLNLDKNLIGVTQDCNYPKTVKNKEIIGNIFSINKEKVLELYLKNDKKINILALISSKPFLSEFNNMKGIDAQYFEFKNIDDIYSAMAKIGKIYGVESEAKTKAVAIKKEIAKYHTKNSKNILYLIQSEPMITVGKDSYITEVIRQSGNFSATSGIKGEYPSISKEYAASLSVDIVMVDNFQTEKRLDELKIFYPNARFIRLTQEQKDIINRPGPRVAEAVKLFYEISLNTK